MFGSDDVCIVYYHHHIITLLLCWIIIGHWCMVHFPELVNWSLVIGHLRRHGAALTCSKILHAPKATFFLTL